MSVPATSIRHCVAVMAGGRGLRLWPRSTRDAPKQFHSFFGGPALLRQTISNAALLAPRAQTYVVTTLEHQAVTRAMAGPDVRVLTEPFGRNTAACAGLAALHIERDHPGAVAIFLPADHWIGDPEAFVRTLRSAIGLAAAHDCLVTVGVRPSRPETGYGYIEAEQSVAGYFRGKRFREKPNEQEAVELISRGDVFWNSGIYVARATVLLKLIRQHLPDLGAGLDCIAGALDSLDEENVKRVVYTGLSDVSLDCGIAEKQDHFLLVEAEFPWDDLGSWSAFSRLLLRDSASNLTEGRVLTADAAGCLVDTPDLMTVLLGVRDLIVVQEGDRLLICSSDRAQDVKHVASAVDAQSSGAGPRIVSKPWGHEIWWAVTPFYAGKVLEVRAGERLSLQYHRHKLESLYFERGEGEFVLGEQRLAIYPGMAATVQPGTLHQIIAHTNLRILEVSTPHLDDLVRVQDDYGRLDSGGGSP